MRKRFKGLLSFIMFLLIISLVLLIFYFVYKNYKNEGGDIKITGDLSINYHDGNKLEIDKTKKTKITIINNGSEDEYYYIEFVNPKNVKNIKYTLTDNKLVNINDDMPKHNEIISSYILIKSGEIQDYDLSFSNNGDEIVYLEINIEKESLGTSAFAETILKHNTIKEKSDTEVGKEVALNDEGLIKTTDDYGTSYFFRGNVTNNNVLINDLKFKIVRINGDGSVRLVLDGETQELKKYIDTNDKYYYKDSVIKSYLDSWIDINLSSYTSFLATQKYCNDILLNDGEFYAYTRVIKDNIPSLICLSEKVSSKVALLTVDEVLFAGASPTEENKSFYLYNENITNDSYLMSSAKIVSGEYYPFTLTENGMVSIELSGSYLRSIRPVITIIKTALVEGDGTIDNPYKLIKN